MLGLADTDRPSEASRYLTDGVNLYRYLGAIPSTIGQLIRLEECRSLDVTLWRRAAQPAAAHRAFRRWHIETR
jgi:hypothetical protein